jgi:hypothetical protein
MPDPSIAAALTRPASRLLFRAWRALARLAPCRGGALPASLAIVLLLALPVGAEPAPPFTAPGVSIQAYGIYCRPGTTTREAAPDTSLGYINLIQGLPVIAFRQQEVPARLGIHFGLIVTIDRDIADVRAETWKPGATRPEVWFTDHLADTPRARGFVFEFPEELVTGFWRMEAYDGDTLLYSVEWEVLPGTDLPGVTSDCDLLA